MEMLYLITHWFALSIKTSRLFFSFFLACMVVLLIEISNQGCTILSGDVIIRHLAAQFKPEYVVFLVFNSFQLTLGPFLPLKHRYIFVYLSLHSNLTYVKALLFFNYCGLKTDVLGVYDRPPSESDAILLREIGNDSIELKPH